MRGRILNPKAEGRNPNEGRNPRSECAAWRWSFQPLLPFGFRPSVFLRPSALGLRALVPLLSWFLSLTPSLGAQTLSDEALAQIRFDQKLGSQVTPALSFRDEEGRPVRLSQYFGQKPVLLVLGYYECPMLCTLVLNGMVESAADLKWSIGQEFEVVNVSINPTETPALAAAKKRSYLKRYGRSSAAQGWHFLTGDEAAIRQLANEVGFRYAFDPASNQYAHPSGLIFLTPEGKVSGYLFGVTFAPRDLYASLQAASTHQVSSPIRQLILLCFHYNPVTGKYSGLIIVILRVLGAVTILGFLGLIVTLVRRGRAAEAALRGNPKPETRNPKADRLPPLPPGPADYATRHTQHGPSA
jgi:protein SCO1